MESIAIGPNGVIPQTQLPVLVDNQASIEHIVLQCMQWICTAAVEWSHVDPVACSSYLMTMAEKINQTLTYDPFLPHYCGDVLPYPPPLMPDYANNCMQNDANNYNTYYQFQNVPLQALPVVHQQDTPQASLTPPPELLLPTPSPLHSKMIAVLSKDSRETVAMLQTNEQNAIFESIPHNMSYYSFQNGSLQPKPIACQQDTQRSSPKPPSEPPQATPPPPPSELNVQSKDEETDAMLQTSEHTIIQSIPLPTEAKTILTPPAVTSISSAAVSTTTGVTKTVMDPASTTRDYIHKIAANKKIPAYQLTTALVTTTTAAELPILTTVTETPVVDSTSSCDQIHEVTANQKVSDCLPTMATTTTLETAVITSTNDDIQEPKSVSKFKPFALESKPTQSECYSHHLLSGNLHEVI